MTQSEFLFAQPYVTAEHKRIADNNRLLNFFASKIPQDFLTNLFKDSNMMDTSGPSFPIDVLLGERNQFEFLFVRPMDEAAWKGLPIVYAYESN